MLIVPSPLLRRIVDAAEAAYPEEACGLLIGHGSRRARLTGVAPSANLAADRRTGFEVDPAVRFRLMRDLAGNKERIVGHYHSHPDCAPIPSATDLAMAYEPEFFWIITGVFGGQALVTGVFRLDAARGRIVKVPLALA